MLSRGAPEPIVDRTAKAFLRHFLGNYGVYIQLVQGPEHAEEISCGFVQIAVLGKDKVMSVLLVAMLVSKNARVTQLVFLDELFNVSQVKWLVGRIVLKELARCLGL